LRGGARESTRELRHRPLERSSPAVDCNDVGGAPEQRVHAI
jgi:hypothetical protein